MWGNSSSGKTLATLLLTTAGAALISVAASVVLEKCREKTKAAAASQAVPVGKNDKVDPEIEKCFRAACEEARTLTQISNTEKLVLYSLFKQSTEGDAPQKSGAFMLNFVDKAKFTAWSRLRGMSRTNAMMHYMEAVQQLILHGSMDSEGDEDVDALDMGGGFGNKPSTMMMVDEEDDDKKDLTPGQKLLKAAGQNDVDLLKRLLTDYPALIKHKDEDGQTPLHLAADKGAMDALKALLEAGANGNAADGDGITVLQAAVIADNVEVCKVLLENGANPDHADSDGDTPRTCAQDDGSDEMKKLFSKNVQNQFE